MEVYERFEERYAKWAGIENLVGCSSGTSALHLALEALQLPKGSEVIVPDYSMIACARAVTLAGLVPVFVDCGRDMLIDPVKVDEVCYRNLATDDSPVSTSSEIKAIMAVHVYGRSCNMPAIHDIAGKYGLKVIEDLAEAHLTHPHPNTHASSWSFYKNKVVFGEEGGAVSFLDRECGNRARRMRSLGFTDEHDYWHEPRGHNYRLSNSHASLICQSLDHVGMWVDMRRRQEKVLGEVISDLLEHPVTTRPDVSPMGTTPTSSRDRTRETPWVYDIHLPGITVREQQVIVSRLQGVGVAARYGFKPLRLQEEYLGRKPDGKEKLMLVSSGWMSDVFAREVIYLPLGQSATMDTERMGVLTCQVIRETLGISQHSPS